MDGAGGNCASWWGDVVTTDKDGNGGFDAGGDSHPLIRPVAERRRIDGF